MTRQEVFNFSAGPSMMPESALLSAQKDLLSYGSTGVSVMEMSHRTPMFEEIFAATKQKLRDILGIPDNYEILLTQGGATLQFASIPMNLLEDGFADYAITGNFSKRAANEARKYGQVRLSCDTGDTGHNRIPSQDELIVHDDAKYFYYCSNNTAFGTEWNYVPEVKAPIVCDMSSDILSRPVDISKYGLIYAGAQKNMAPAGLTVIIIDKALAGKHMPITPEVMEYSTLIRTDSLLNTPPCWCIYMLGLVLDWVKTQGGVEGIEVIKKEKSKKIYDVLDNSSFYIPHALASARSDMNMTFRTPSEELDAEFVKDAAAKGLINLKGHKVAGGIRASVYNAMPMEGVDKLVSFMKEFEAKHV